MKMRVCWVPQIPMKEEFRVEVKSMEEAKKFLDTLANYDNFLVEKKLRPDNFANTGWLEVYKGEWIEWHGKMRQTIDDYTIEECRAMDKQKGWFRVSL